MSKEGRLSSFLGTLRALRRPRRKRSPRLFVLAGGMGAGKSLWRKTHLKRIALTVGFESVEALERSFIDIDEEAAQRKVSRLSLKREIEERILDYIRRGESFGFETTLAGKGETGPGFDGRGRIRGKIELITMAQEAGYEVYIVFLSPKVAKISVERVQDRQIRGRHGASKETVRQTLYGAIGGEAKLRRIAKRIEYYDTTDVEALLVAVREGGRVKMIVSLNELRPLFRRILVRDWVPNLDRGTPLDTRRTTTSDKK